MLHPPRDSLRTLWIGEYNYDREAVLVLIIVKSTLNRMRSLRWRDGGQLGWVPPYKAHPHTNGRGGEGDFDVIGYRVGEIAWIIRSSIV